MKTIYRKCREKGFQFAHVCEVGVYLPETSNVLDFIADGCRTTLVEPDQDTLHKIKNYFLGYKNITIVPVAVYDYNGTIRLAKANASTFIAELPDSPALTNDNYVLSAQTEIEVECRQFSAIDDGTIDLLSIDIEGAEWYVLKYIVSKPKVISIETHGKFYTNPFITEINDWLAKNNYMLWYKDGSDSVYVQQGLCVITPQEQQDIRRQERSMKIRKLKKYLYKLLGI
jgi:FkbM family methyltransferase